MGQYDCQSHDIINGTGQGPLQTGLRIQISSRVLKVIIIVNELEVEDQSVLISALGDIDTDIVV
ncbi:uncharacterized protein PG998_009997 [Apiospora kogelbergensis]|uniref:Uncharacterized protein n=1 Tax=Apiospora kogelbergensis TaxID=1337665 RepID=A0AAW0R9E7_9PEZI